MHKKLIISLAILIICLGGGYYWYHHLTNAAPSDHATIATGQLRDTTFSLVASAENSTTNYHRQYAYIEDIGDGRGYTADIIGFTTATGDLRQVVQRYQKLRPGNSLTVFLPALKKVQGSASHRGLGRKFVKAWQQAAQDKRFVQAQNDILNQQYLQPALTAAKTDGLGPLGQYIYYDALVVHGPGSDASSFGGIRRQAKQHARTPSQGGSQTTYLETFLKCRSKIMRQETAHQDLSRIKTQQQFIRQKKFNLQRPLSWTMYGDHYHLK
ncbi:chitosanase [Lapidilactobacillus wuchangensis]|uniref:chitosanase n=1 Tax=Lapidilactobacillus wuchangensis TaxID=2486001 RepID=UPI000F77DDB5|nr:chitosanase [Lapidilactobacillus wuchangensis]